jgi:hypothetical protein
VFVCRLYSCSLTRKSREICLWMPASKLHSVQSSVLREKVSMSVIMDARKKNWSSQEEVNMMAAVQERERVLFKSFDGAKRSKTLAARAWVEVIDVVNR